MQEVTKVERAIEDASQKAAATEPETESKADEAQDGAKT